MPACRFARAAAPSRSRRRLSDELWEQFSPWLDAWGVHDDRTKGLYFFGTGRRRLGAADVQMLSRWTDRAIAHVRGH